MKQTIQTTLLCGTFALVLGGCALPFGGNAATEAKPVEIVTTTDTARTIRHAFGETAFPLAPKRVLSLGEDAMLVDLIDIGVTPVAANVNLPEQVPLLGAQAIEGVKLFPSATEISIEKLADYKPDAIIGTTFFIEQIGYDKLRQIAPTVAVSGNGLTDQYRETLTAFGQREQAESNIAAFSGKVQREGQRLQARNRQVSVGAIYPGPSVAVWADGPLPPPQILKDLGFTLRPNPQDVQGMQVRGGRAFIDLERLDLLASDTLILLQSDQVEGETAAVAAIKANPLWQKLPAVQAKRVFTLDRLGYPGFRGLQKLLADLVAIVEP